jgi:hypothetical protein
MTEQEVSRLMGRFRRDMFLASGFRWAFLGVMIGCVAAAGAWRHSEYQQIAWIAILTAAVGWALLAWMSFGQARQAGLGEILLETGRLEDAERNLCAALGGFGIFRHVKLIAAHNLAAVFFARREYAQGSVVCREVLRHRFGQFNSLQRACRLLWADCLLMLNDVGGAYDAFRPLYDCSLSLQEQLRLLPVQIRYELAARQEAQTVNNIISKVRLSDMLDSPTAGLVNAMLAEACRRRGLREQWRYLARRAWLYTELDALVPCCPAIEPIAADPPVTSGVRRQEVGGAGDGSHPGVPGVLQPDLPEVGLGRSDG